MALCKNAPALTRNMGKAMKQAVKIVEVSVDRLDSIVAFMRSVFEAHHGLCQLHKVGPGAMPEAVASVLAHQLDMLNCLDVELEQVYSESDLVYREVQA